MAAKKILTAEAILACDDIVREEVDVPEWGGSVRIRSFSRRQLHELTRKATVGKEVNAEKLDMLLFINGVEEPTFDESHMGQLSDKSAGVLQTVLGRIMALSGLDPDAAEKAEASFPKES